VKSTDKDIQYGLFSNYSAISLHMFAKQQEWKPLPSDKIFEFVYELDLRLQGQPGLKKELSYYGAIRCTESEVQEALDNNTVTNYEVGIAHNKQGVMFCRATMDPMNQIYASWLCTIAGLRRDEIWSNNRERLGDMVETALGFCKLVDEYVDTLGNLLGDPNSMSNRIEASIRLSIGAEHHRYYKFGTGRPPRGKKHPRQSAYSDEVLLFADSMPSALITIEDVLGPRQTRKVFSSTDEVAPVAVAPAEDMDTSTDEDIPYESRTCRQCNNGSILRECSCEASKVYRAIS
jgi:hypothetical protein